MINWSGVFWNGLWIVGAAILLAVLSFGSWRASATGSSLSEELSRRTTALSARIGWVVFCAGLAGLGDAWWKQSVWILLALLNVVQGWRGWRAGCPPNLS